MRIATKFTGAVLATTLLATSVAGTHAAPAYVINLPAPTNVAPADGASVNLPITLDWTAVSGAASYRVSVEDVTTHAHTAFDRTAITNPIGLAFAVLPSGYVVAYAHTYIWNVRACTSVGCGVASTSTEFTVGGYPNNPSANPDGPELRSATVQANTPFDFLSGTSNPTSGDIFFDSVVGSSYMGVQLYAAADSLADFGVVAPKSVTLPQLQMASFTAPYIDNTNAPADLQAGDVFAVKLDASGAIVRVVVTAVNYGSISLQYQIFA